MCVCVCVCIYIYIYLNHFAVHLKLTQHCKSTILQLIKKVWVVHLWGSPLASVLVAVRNEHLICVHSEWWEDFNQFEMISRSCSFYGPLLNAHFLPLPVLWGGERFRRPVCIAVTDACGDISALLTSVQTPLFQARTWWVPFILGLKMGWGREGRAGVVSYCFLNLLLHSRDELFIYLFIGCVGSSFLCEGFL